MGDERKPALQVSSKMAKKSKSKEVKSNVPENYARWYNDIFEFLDQEKDRFPKRSDLEVRYLETCQQAILVCEQLGITLPDKLE